jgi:hypothetical protein
LVLFYVCMYVYIYIYMYNEIFSPSNKIHREVGRTKDLSVPLLSTNCCTQTVAPPDDGPRYARNTYRLTKCTIISCASTWFFFTRLYSQCVKVRQWVLAQVNYEVHEMERG